MKPIRALVVAFACLLAGVAHGMETQEWLNKANGGDSGKAIALAYLLGYFEFQQYLDDMKISPGQMRRFVCIPANLSMADMFRYVVNDLNHAKTKPIGTAVLDIHLSLIGKWPCASR